MMQSWCSSVLSDRYHATASLSSYAVALLGRGDRTWTPDASRTPGAFEEENDLHPLTTG
jgi:hypothetical protein